MRNEFDTRTFESRKQDHVQISMQPSIQALELSQFQNINLIHEALPDLDFEDIDLSTPLLGHSLRTPLFVSSMTAGHAGGRALNVRLAKACESRGWLLGVGSQRRELHDPEALREWSELRREAPNAVIFGNLGISQLISEPAEKIEELVKNLEAQGLFIHTNPLQECLQPEGTPQFSGGLRALEKLCARLKVPVVLKEVGCGFSEETLRRVDQIGLYAVDVSGAGGTHWGRIETARGDSSQHSVGTAFQDWGISTVESLLNSQRAQVRSKVWASGGIRNGVDAAKSIALGAEMVGLAQPILKAALESEAALQELMQGLENELKVALFSTGQRTPGLLKQKGAWKWKISQNPLKNDGIL